MDEFPEKEPPRAWISAGIFLAAFTLAYIILVYRTIDAHAQPLCAPFSQIAPAWEEIHKERVIWEGVMPTPQGPTEFVLLQSPSGTWSLFAIRSGIACLQAAGQNGIPNELGRGV